MNRREAIDAIMSTWAQRDQEFVVSQDEGEASDRELHEALNALGVTNAEIDGEEGGEIAPAESATAYAARAFAMCRRVGHEMFGSDPREPEGRQRCRRCGTIKEWTRRVVTFTYPEVQS